MAATGIECTVFGLLVLAQGLHAYLSPRAEAFYKRLPIGPFINILYGQIPGGLGFVLGGVGMLVDRRPITDALLLSLLGLMAVAVLSWFWHPYFVRPRWLRNTWGD